MPNELTADDIIKNFHEGFEFMGGVSGVDYALGELQRKDYERLIEYPYPIMNQKLNGIFPTSFVVIGSDYGGGKSELCGDIAINACKQGKKVFYFDFENDSGDFYMRQLCKKISRSLGRDFCVSDLRKEDVENGPHADLIYELSAELADELSGLMLYKNDHIPNIEQFLENLESITDADLICIDHLHYFNMEDSDDEKRAIGKIMRELRVLTKVKRIPVVLISHLTKRDKNKLPTASDFYGSSNIAKEAKTCILLHRDDENLNTMIIDKNRDGRYTCKLEYKYDPINACLDFSPQEGFSPKSW